MQYFKKVILVLLVLVFVLPTGINSQGKVKTKNFKKVPKVSLMVTGGFSYVVGSANGDSRGFSSFYEPTGGNIFNAKSLGMQEGYGVNVLSNFIVSKNKKFGITGEAGYNHFYNTMDNGMNRTRWNIISLGAGVQYNFTPKEKESLFLGYGIHYNLLFGAWQSDITYPDNSVSNIYTWFNPASRIGMSATAGMLVRLNKKTDLVLSLKGVWANVFSEIKLFFRQGV
ncbi:MAG: hypothetical protein UZ05_CHB002001919 [Chlorobi bacterium OLB5]|nr:MAG: hypothetical protein UZ05_CHB002001919 [Chlorobi bacterium OLB5]